VSGPETGERDARAPGDAGQAAIGRQLRGSSLLLVGRMLSKAVNFGVQVAIVRLLTKDDYGAFAYGLALVLSGELVVKFGLGRGANRFVPLYAERGQHAEVMGTLALVCSTIVVLGTISFGVLWWVAGLGWTGFPSGEGARVVLILAWLAPIQALDTICIQTLACFSRPRAIFFRKHVLGPGLRAVAVLIAFLLGSRSDVLAGAYLLGGVLGVVVCLRLTLRELFVHGVLPLPVSAWRVPWRPLFRFSMPLMSSDLVFIALTMVTTILLMWSHGEAGVASMRAVAPAAALNTLVAQSFELLFMPAAIRFHAQGDVGALRQHYWQSASWVAVLSFPVFALTFGVAPDLVPLLLGHEYAGSAGLLALLAVGHYASACVGFNGDMLQVFERTRAIVWTDAMTIVVGVGLSAALCPALGALGVAIALTVARLGGTLARQQIMLREPGFESVPAVQKHTWLRVGAGSLTIAALGWLWQPPFLGQLLLVVVVTLILLRSTARTLDIAGSFPELLRVPLLAKVVGV
jgi:O-antigen/teichoic acid export membrane protein